MRARYYSPELRRFINADIVAGEITNAVTLNRYAYANGNPVLNTDPFGAYAVALGTGANTSSKIFNNYVGDGGSETGRIKDQRDSSSENQEKDPNDTSNQQNNLTNAEKDEPYLVQLFNALHKSFIFDFGFGGGLGGSAKVDGVTATALLRYDVFTLRKDASSHEWKVGEAFEEYAGFEALRCEFYKGYKSFDPYDEKKEYEMEELYANIDRTSTIGGSIYFFGGFTFEIGFDFVVFIEEITGLDIVDN